MPTVPDLYPIVIPPIEVKIGNKTFTCAGDGLLKDGHSYESNLKQFLPLSEPKKTKTGAIAAKQPAPPSKPLAFWKAQCAFRNFVQNGSIEALQSRLGGTDPKMDKDLAKEQTRVNKEFRLLNDNARKQNWSTLSTDEDRASIDPERFLRDRFFRQTTKKPSAKGEAIILKTNDRIKIHQAAGPLDLFTESTEAPLEPNGSIPKIDRWIVVGTSEAAVRDKIREIYRPSMQKASAASKARQLPAVKNEPKTSKAKSASLPNAAKSAPQTITSFPPKRRLEDSPSSGFSPFLTTDGPPRKKQVAQKFTPSQKFVGPSSPSESPRKSVGSYNWPDDSRGYTLGASSTLTKSDRSIPHNQVKKESADSKSQIYWDVTGKWRIYCQDLEEGWTPRGRRKPELSMTIHCQHEGAKYQLWALFDWYPLEGAFRFLEPQPSSTASTAPSRDPKNHIKSEPDSDGKEFAGAEVFDDFLDDQKVSKKSAPVPPSAFSLSSLPSASVPTVPFRWRGRGQDGGHLEPYSDHDPCSMTFSADGAKCNGVFANTVTDPVQFSGFKVDGTVPKPEKGPQREWKTRGIKAYEREASERWGKRYWDQESSNDDE